MDTTLNAILQSSTLRDKLSAVEPCYLLDGERFARNLAEFHSAFKAYFGDKFIPAYSTKTNPDAAVLEVLNAAKDWRIEIVSEYERHWAHANNFEPCRIVYNGVVPDDYGKFMVAASGGIVNVENYDELDRIAALAERLNVAIEVGLRVNIGIDEKRKWKSRFGIPIGTNTFQKCLDRQSDYMKIVGLHCHIHGCRSLPFWRKRAEIMGRVAKRIEAKYIDFGSNMFGFMDPRLAAQFDCEIPSATDYAETIHGELKWIYGNEELPVVIVEPGTPVVADAVSLVGSIATITDRGFDTIATASCSIYDCGFFHGSDKHPPVDIVHMSPGAPYENVEIFGYACTEDDTVCQSYTGRLAVDDLIMVRNVGAYGKSLSSDFIKQAMKTYDLRNLK